MPGIYTLEGEHARCGTNDHWKGLPNVARARMGSVARAQERGVELANFFSLMERARRARLFNGGGK